MNNNENDTRTTLTEALTRFGLSLQHVTEAFQRLARGFADIAEELEHIEWETVKARSTNDTNPDMPEENR